MRRLLATALTAALLALPAAEPAAAFPVDTAPAAASRALATPVAFRHTGGGIRRGFGGHRLGGLRRGFGARRFGGLRRGFVGGRFYGSRRSGIGGAVAGLAAGAIIGTVLAGAAHASNAVAYCERRFKSYNPATRTYVGYDGLRHRCP